MGARVALWGALWLGLVSTAGAEGVAAQVSSAQSSPPKIRQISLRVDHGPEQEEQALDLAALRRVFAAEIGQIFDDEAARRILANVHAAGLFDRIEIYRDAPTEHGQVALTLRLSPSPRVGAIVLQGELGLRQRTLERVLRLKPGAALDQRWIDADAEALRELYRRNYFLEARVATRVDPGWQDPKRVENGGRTQFPVFFELAAGRRARIGTLTFAGDLGGLAPATLASKLRTRAGKSPSGERLEADRRRLRHFLRNQGFLTATVGLEETYDPNSGLLNVRFDLQAGPPIELVGKGIEVKTLLKRRLVVFAEDGPLDEISLEQSRQRILEDLQRRGYYRAQVAVHLESSPDRVSPDRVSPDRVLFEVDKGAEYRLSELTFAGAAYFDAAELARHLSVAPRRSWWPGSGRLRDLDLEADLANLTSFYRLQGFDQAKVGPPVIAASPPASGARFGDLRLEIPLVEGRRLRVVDVIFDGVATFDAADLAPRLPLHPGSPYHPLLLDDALNVLRALYEEEGFPWALVDADQQWNADGTLVEITFKVDEGPRLELNRLIVRHQVRTDPELIRRAVALESGEVLSRRRLLRAQRDLYRLGIFSSVEVRLAPTAEAPTASRRNVLVQVEEATPWRLSYGVSYHSADGIGGLFGVSRINLGGDGGRFQLDLRGSARDRRARWVYDRPFLGKAALPFTASLFLREEDRPAFDVREKGAQLSLAREFGRSRASVFYDYRLVDLAVVDPTESIERENADVEISSITPDFLFDRRDDPINPSRGFQTNLRLEWAFPWLDADADFLKLFLQQTLYLDLGRYGTLAASLRVGAIEPFGPAGEYDPVLPRELASAQIPISERFFAGGRTTHRAYNRDELGIVGKSLLLRADGTPLEVGGNGLFLFNLDYRFPVSGAVGGVIFVDVGNIWADWRDVETKDLRPGIGLGVRYLSPIGPVRLELGWKLDRQFFEDSAPVFLLSLGNPF